MTLKEALIKIKEEQNIDLFNNKDRVLDMLSDLLPGEIDEKKIKNRVKWAYEQGAIKALASTPDHAIARNKAIAILKANTDINETAISDTIDSFCMALKWEDAVPSRVQNSPVQTSPPPTTKPVHTSATQPISSPYIPSNKNQNTANPSGNIAPKSFSFGYIPIPTTGQTPKNALVNDIKNIIDGNVTIDNYVRKRANRLLDKYMMNIIVHFLIQIIFFAIICIVDANDVDDTSGILYTFFALFFFLWEGGSFVRNITVSSTEFIRSLLLGIVVIMITAVYFVVPAVNEKFDGSDFELLLQVMFWITMLLGNIGRFIRMKKN